MYLTVPFTAVFLRGTMLILRKLLVSVDQLASSRALLPSVEEQRPRICESCGEPAHPPGGGLRIVGHGTYERQLLGHPDAGRELLIPVRRYLCRSCRRTMSVLPADAYPRRWYSAACILVVLVQLLLRKVTTRELRLRFGLSSDEPGWRSPSRWSRELLSPLWAWLRQTLGLGAASLERASRAWELRRLLGYHGLSEDSEEAQLIALATALGADRVFDGGVSPRIRPAPSG